MRPTYSSQRLTTDHGETGGECTTPADAVAPVGLTPTPKEKDPEAR
jgi:hypothetical protein